MHGLSFTVMDVWFNVFGGILIKWHWFVGHMSLILVQFGVTLCGLT